MPDDIFRDDTSWPPAPSVAPVAVNEAADPARRAARFGAVSLALVAAPVLLWVGIFAYVTSQPVRTTAEALVIGCVAIATAVFPALGLIFGILGRRSTAGKVGIALSTLGVASILALLVLAYLVGMHRIALAHHMVTVHHRVRLYSNP